jgi:hypothetical protein
MEAKVVRQLERALRPLLTDVRVDWGPLLTPLLQFPAAPAVPRPLYPGCRTLLLAVLDPAKGAWCARGRARPLACICPCRVRAAGWNQHGARDPCRSPTPLHPALRTWPSRHGRPHAQVWCRPRAR